jgi:putative Holliday junction resolvase
VRARIDMQANAFIVIFALSSVFILEKFLGLDFGKVRIGIALSDQSLTFAFGREFIDNDKNTLTKIISIIEAENVTRIVLGYPLNLKGEKTKQTLEVEQFESMLRSIAEPLGIGIIRWDERFTSKIAAESLIESGMKKKKRQNKGNVDIVSAAVLLQSYLDSIKQKMT